MGACWTQREMSVVTVERRGRVRMRRINVVSVRGLAGGDFFFRSAGLSILSSTCPGAKPPFPRDDQGKGRAPDQVGIVKFGPRRLVTVVPEDFDAGTFAVIGTKSLRAG